MKEIQMNQITNKLENNFYAVTYITETEDTLCPRMFVQVKQKKMENKNILFISCLRLAKNLTILLI